MAEHQGDEQLIQQLEEELKKLKVADLLVQTVYTISSLAYRKLSEDDRDLDQARLAIEALQALQGVLVDPAAKDVQNLVASLQPHHPRRLIQRDCGAQYATIASSNSALSSSGPAGRGASLVTRCCGSVPCTSVGMSDVE